MFTLFILNEIITNGLNYYLLHIISLLSILSGIMVIISKNPIISVLFLIGLFFNIASYIMMLGINFIGLSYLLVYVGAVSILFLFILMLINVRISELLTDNNNSFPLLLIIGFVFSITLFELLPGNYFNKKYNYYLEIDNSKDTAYNITEYVVNLFVWEAFFFYSEKILFVTSNTWDSVLGATSHITSIGNILYTIYPLWLILTSLILLLAMVGSIVITIKNKI